MTGLRFIYPSDLTGEVFSSDLYFLIGLFLIGDFFIGDFLVGEDPALFPLFKYLKESEQVIFDLSKARRVKNSFKIVYLSVSEAALAIFYGRITFYTSTNCSSPSKVAQTYFPAF